MDIVRGLDALPLPDGPSVVTIGFFDGVHLGHQEVFRRTVEAARERDARSVAVTFDRHPRETLTPGEEFSVCVTVTVRIPLLPEFIEANTATGQFVVERDRYADG